MARTDAGSRWPTAAVVGLLLLVVVAGAGAYELGWIDYWRGAEQARPQTTAAPAGVARITPGDTRVAAAHGSTPLRAKAVRAAMAPALSDKRFGGRLAAWVAPLAGRPVLSHGSWASMPASTTKLLTTAAALAEFGPDHRFTTRVVKRGDTVTLVGGGDPLLGSDDVRDLAKRTAAALRHSGTRSVKVGYDTTLFRGPSVSPDWEKGYVPEETVPINPLVVDSGHLAGSDGEVGTDDDGFTMQPAVRAADVFASALSDAGITVTGEPAKHGSGGRTVASHGSDTLAEIVEYTLKHSDNHAAEFLARQVGLADGDPTFAGGVRGVLARDRALGIPTRGIHLVDGSGLSRDDRIPARSLVSVLQHAASPAHRELRPILEGLPVAGFDGSLLDRFYNSAEDARGVVRAKTGTLTGAHALAGIVTDHSGTPMIAVLMADRVSDSGSLAARDALDDAMADLASCSCG